MGEPLSATSQRGLTSVHALCLVILINRMSDVKKTIRRSMSRPLHSREPFITHQKKGSGLEIASNPSGRGIVKAAFSGLLHRESIPTDMRRRTPLLSTQGICAIHFAAIQTTSFLCRRALAPCNK